MSDSWAMALGPLGVPECRSVFSPVWSGSISCLSRSKIARQNESLCCASHSSVRLNAGPSEVIAQESDIEAGELESYLIDGDGVLLRYFPEESDSSESFKTVIPRDLRVAALRHYHDADGHGSAPKSWHKLRRFATWPGMKGQLCRYVRSCAVCQERKPRGGRPPGLLEPIVSTRPWEIAACDLMGPLPRSSGGYQHVLVVTCHFTGFVEMFPMRKVTAKGVLSRLSEVWCRYGFPERLVSDNASIFCSKVFAATCQALGIKHCKTSCYHPQANVTERRNRDIKPLLGAYARKQRDWDLHLDSISFALRSNLNRSTGFTPALLNFGRELSTPTDAVLRPRQSAARAVPSYEDFATRTRERLSRALDAARGNRARARAEQKNTYDKAHRDAQFEVGDTVLRRSHVQSDASKFFSAALAPKWVGPFVIDSKKSRLTYTLRDQNSDLVRGTVHIGELKPFFPREGDEPVKRPQRGIRGRQRSQEFLGPPRHSYNTRSRRQPDGIGTS
ncbi:uncharacterized protein ISCGN_032664 [Ixodes scapularis]